jgi:hypothetical protein
MTQKNECVRDKKQMLQTLFAAELFSKLSKVNQQIIIAQIKGLLSHE